MTLILDPVARVYAQALAEAAEAKGGMRLLQECGEGLARAARTWRERPSYPFFFLSPQVAEDKKEAVLDGLLEAAEGAGLAKDFLRLLLRRGRLLQLPAIAAAYQVILDERLGRMPVTISTASPVPPDGIARWTELLRRALGKDPVVKHVVKPELVAGAVILAGDVVADGSARRRLDDLRRRIIERGTHAPEA